MNLHPGQREKERESEMGSVMASKWLLGFCLLWLSVTSKKLLHTCIQITFVVVVVVVVVFVFVTVCEIFRK